MRTFRLPSWLTGAALALAAASALAADVKVRTNRLISQ